MKYATDIEALKISCQQMRGRLEELRRLNHSFTLAAGRLNAAPHYNASQAHSITRDLSNRADGFQYYLDVIEYWSNILEIALKAKYVPESLLQQFNTLTGQGQGIIDGTIINKAVNFNQAEAWLIATGQFILNLTTEGCKVASNASNKAVNFLDNALNWFDNRVSEFQNFVGDFISSLVEGFKLALGQASNALNLAGNLLETLGNHIKEGFQIAVFEKAVNFLEGGLTVIGWVSDATWIKNAGTWVGHFTKILTLVDLVHYFSGNVTNLDILVTSSKDFIPIPIVNEWVGEYIGQLYAAQNWSNPGGYFQLIVPLGGDLNEWDDIQPGDWAKHTQAAPLPLDKFIASKLEESYNTAKDYYNKTINFSMGVITFVADRFQDTTQMLQVLSEKLRASFLAGINAISIAVMDGFNWIGALIFGPYIAEAGPIMQGVFARNNQPTQREDFTTYEIKVNVKIPLPTAGIFINLGGTGTATVTRKWDSERKKWVVTVTLTGEREGGVSTIGPVEGGVSNSNKVSVELTFDEDNVTDMGRLAILMETLGVKDGKVNNFYNNTGLELRAAGGLVELGWFRSNVSKIEGAVGTEVSANINLGQLIDLKASQGMEMGVAMVKDGYGNFNPAITLKGTRSISVDVAGMVEAAVNVTVSATVCTQDNEIDAVQGKLTLVVSAGMNIAQALMASGISREVAQQIAQVNMLNGGLVTDVTGEIELSYTVSGLKGNVKTPLEALEFALKHGKVEAHLSLSTSVSNGTEVLGNGFSTNVTNGQKQRVYPPDGSDQLLFTAPSSILVPQKPQLLINSSGGGGGSW